MKIGEKLFRPGRLRKREGGELLICATLSFRRETAGEKGISRQGLSGGKKSRAQRGGIERGRKS